MKPEIQIFIAGIFMSTIGLFTKLIDNNVHPMVIGFYRIFFGMIILAIISPFIDKTTFKPKKKDLKMYAIIGLLFSLIFTFTCLAYNLAPINNVVLIMGLSPFFVLIFADFILKEKITRKKIITLIIALIGFLIINPLKAEGLQGNLIALLIAILGAIMVVLMRKEDSNHSIGDVFWFFLFGTLFTLPFAIYFGFGQINIFVVLIGVLSTGLCYLFYNLGLENLEAETVSVISSITTPVLSIILAIVIIHELVLLRTIIGGIILILAGIYLELHIHKKKKKKRSIRHMLLLHSK